MISQYGIEGTRGEVARQRKAACDALSLFGADADFFRSLVDSMIDRTK